MIGEDAHLESAYESANGSDVEIEQYEGMPWVEASPFVVEECDLCGAAGDTYCIPGCDAFDDRAAEIDGGLEHDMEGEYCEGCECGPCKYA